MSKTAERLDKTIKRLNLCVVELQQSYQELREEGGPKKEEEEEGFERYARYYNLSLATLMILDKLRTEAKILGRVIQEIE